MTAARYCCLCGTAAAARWLRLGDGGHVCPGCAGRWVLQLDRGERDEGATGE